MTELTIEGTAWYKLIEAKFDELSRLIEKSSNASDPHNSALVCLAMSKVRALKAIEITYSYSGPEVKNASV